MQFVFKFKDQTFHLLLFIVIFQLNNFSDCIFYWASLFNYDNDLIQLSLIEIVVYITFQIILIFLLDIKSKLKATQTTLDLHQLFSNFILLLTCCEFEIAKGINLSRNSIFSFVLGVFIFNTLRFIKNQKFKIICLSVNFLYIIIRYNQMSLIHAQRLILLFLCSLIYKKWKNVKQNNSELINEIKTDSYLSNLLFTQILKEYNEEGIAMFDSKINFMMNNDKLIKTINCMDDPKKNLIKIRLKFVSIDPNLEIYKKDMKDLSSDIFNLKLVQSHVLMSSEEHFKNQEDFSLGEIMKDLIYFTDNDASKENSTKNDESDYKTIKLIFNFSKFNEDLVIKEEYYNFRIKLTVFLKNSQIELFLVQVQYFLDSNALINNEKIIQNKKIFYVSHEMRTPLNCIVSMLQVLRPNLPDEMVEEYISPCLISCNFLLYLVQDLLDMAQIESDKFTMLFEEFDIRILVVDIIQLFNFQAKAKNVDIIKKIPNNIPETVISDHRRIRQILINLIGNSLKFLPKKKGQITIELTINPLYNSYINFSVKDNGIGIKEEDKCNLFQAFGKIHNNESKEMNSAGVGLGLMISNNLALNLHPHKSEGLKVESNYGTGTSFSFVVEDKTENINLREHDSFRNPHEIYQSFRKKPSQFNKFIDRKERKEESKYSWQKYDTFNSEIELGYKVDYDQLSPKKITGNPQKKRSTNLNIENSLLLNKQATFNSNKSLRIQKSGLKSFSYEEQSMQSFCDVFICKKNNEEFESSHSKLNLIKEINLSKNCECSDILVVDDNIFNSYSLKKQLESFNLRIECANDGAEAILLVQEYYSSYKKNKCCKSYKIIFMDIEMPGIDGYQTSLEIKKFRQSIKVKLGYKMIACSAHLIEEEPDKHKKYGMDEFVTKPLIKERLIILLGKYLKLESESIILKSLTGNNI